MDDDYGELLLGFFTSILCRFGFHNWDGWQWGRWQGPWAFRRKCQRDCGTYQLRSYMDVKNDKSSNFQPGHTPVEALFGKLDDDE